MPTAETTEAPLERAEGERQDVELLKALAHPMRLKILGVLASRDISPAEFAKETEKDLSNVSYHFRQLEKFGCAEVVGTRQVRGSTEHFYRHTYPIVFDDEVWAKLTSQMRVAMSHTVVQDLLIRIREAFRAGTFDARKTRHLTWMPLQLDEQGWQELVAITLATFEAFERLKLKAGKRLAESGETVIEATAGILAFESPKPTLR